MTELRDKAPGIRVVRVDTKNIDYYNLESAERQKIRFDIYAMMLLARVVTQDDISGNTSIYRTLRFFLNTHSANDAEDIATEYINALVKDSLKNLIFIIKKVLSYKPLERLPMPDYHKVAATLVSA